MTFSDLLAAYTNYLKVKHYSPATIVHYTQHLKDLFAYLDKNGIAGIARVTDDMLTTYLAGLIGSDYATATVALKLRAAKRFFTWLEATNRILINPAEYLKEPKKETRLPRAVLTEAEARKLLNQPNLSTMTGIRDRTILEVLYSTGIRLEELVHLTIYDIDLQGGHVRINKGKGAKDRVVPLGRHAARLLKEYISRIRPRSARNRSLFLNRSGEPLSKQMVRIMIRNHAKDAGIAKKVTPHTFRHTFATTLVRNGADIVAVSKMLGHARLSNTQIYSRVAGMEVKKTHAASHPREKDRAEADSPGTNKKYRRKRR